MRRSRPRILAAHLFLTCALAAGAQAKSVTIRIRAVRGHIEFSHRGERLSDQGLEQLCGAARKQKTEIVFQRDKMTANDALASILGEARCLGARSASPAKTARPPEPKNAARTHARHRRTTGTPR